MTRRPLFVSFFLAAVLIATFTSCITSRKINYMQEPSSRIPTYPDTTTYQDYLLRTGDCLYIKVYALNSDISEVLNGNESNNNLQLISTTSSVSDLFTYIVKPDGNINFPLIGEVAVLGKSTHNLCLMFFSQVYLRRAVSAFDTL